MGGVGGGGQVRRAQRTKLQKAQGRATPGALRSEGAAFVSDAGGPGVNERG